MFFFTSEKKDFNQIFATFFVLLEQKIWIDQRNKLISFFQQFFKLKNQPKGLHDS